MQGNAQVAPAEAVHLLQGTLPVSAQTLPTVELESVDPALLLPTAAAAGGLGQHAADPAAAAAHRVPSTAALLVDLFHLTAVTMGDHLQLQCPHCHFHWKTWTP